MLTLSFLLENNEKMSLIMSATEIGPSILLGPIKEKRTKTSFLIIPIGDESDEDEENDN